MQRKRQRLKKEVSGTKGDGQMENSSNTFKCDIVPAFLTSDACHGVVFVKERPIIDDLCE